MLGLEGVKDCIRWTNAILTDACKIGLTRTPTSKRRSNEFKYCIMKYEIVYEIVSSKLAVKSQKGEW